MLMRFARYVGDSSKPDKSGRLVNNDKLKLCLINAVIAKQGFLTLMMSWL